MTVRGRRVFVGRVPERATFGRVLDEVAAGSPRIVMVGGEPGIGKSSLCREVALEAGRRGMRVISGQCYEQGSLKLPYLPFVEALDQYAREGGKHQEWEETALVARVVPGLRALGFESEAGNEGESPYQLFEAVAGFLRRIGHDQPFVLLLEDLHDADAGTLDLLTHLGRRLGRGHVLVVGTYRDTQIDPPHPLSGTLAALTRSELFERIGLRGLAKEEVGELYREMTGRQAAAGVAEMLYAQTEGNPLFATETVCHLDAQGLLGAGSDAVLRAVPEGLRDVIGRRLQALSTATRAVLSVAAVVGREFRLDVLERVLGAAGSHLAEALDEARAAGIVEEDVGRGVEGTCRFNHALFRQYLYERLPGARRKAVHLAAAAAFEALYGSDVDHAATIAEHLAHSSDALDLERASRLSEDAARRAFSVYAFADGVRITRRACETLQRAGAEDQERRCELLLLLAAGLTEAGQPRQALDGPIGEAFALAEALGDIARASRAASCARTALAFEEPWRALTSAEGKMWALRFDQYAPPRTFERVMADVNLAAIEWAGGAGEPAEVRFEAARDLAWQIGDPAACWFAGGQRVFYPRSPDRAEDRKATIAALLALPREGVPSATLAMAFYCVSEALVEFGDRARAALIWEDLATLARRTGALFTLVYASLVEYNSAVLDGQFDRALAALAETDETVSAAGVTRLIGNRAVTRGYRALLHQGQQPEPELLNGISPLIRAAYQAAAGDLAPVRAFLQVAREPGSPRNPTADWFAALQLEVAIPAGDRDLVSDLASQLEGRLEVTNSLVIINRVLAEAKSLLGHPVEARALFARALQQAHGMGFRPEIALARVGLAALLMASFPGEQEEAVNHLHLAMPELREMGMRPALERAEALLARLEGERAAGTIRHRLPGGLTGREAEVLRLVAAGRTNRQISEELVLSIRTVERHIANIYAKIDAHGKADATAFAIRHGLI